MATSLPTSAPKWCTGVTYDGSGGNDLRNSDVAATFWSQPSGTGGGSVLNVQGGVVGGQGLSVIQATGMTLGVGAGAFVVPNTASAIAGGYVSTLAHGGVLTVQTADPSNPRIDIVCAWVNDLGTSSSTGQVQIFTGTAASSPSPPSPPANSITLAQITVPAGATSIVSGNIADVRPYTAAAGGVVKAALGSSPGYDGMIGFDPSSRRFYHNTPVTGSRQVATLPWPAAYATKNTTYTFPTSSAGTILSVGITTDGYTDIKITTHWVGIFQGVNCGTRQVVLTTWLDGNQLDEVDLMTSSTDQPGIAHLGGTSVYTTSSASGDTPSAATHTVYWKGIANSGSGDVPAIRANATRNAYLRVEPVVL